MAVASPNQHLRHQRLHKAPLKKPPPRNIALPKRVKPLQEPDQFHSAKTMVLLRAQLIQNQPQLLKARSDQNRLGDELIPPLLLLQFSTILLLFYDENN